MRAVIIRKVDDKKKENLVGRKPIRTIVQDLQKKIQTLKSNPALWDALQKRVEKYAGAGTSFYKENMVKRNRLLVSKFDPALKKENAIAMVLINFNS